MKDIQSRGNISTGKTLTLRDSDGDGVITVMFDSYLSGIDIALTGPKGNGVTAVFDRGEFRQFIQRLLDDMENI